LEVGLKIMYAYFDAEPALEIGSIVDREWYFFIKVISGSG
jgi:hypothetical protein